MSIVTEGNEKESFYDSITLSQLKALVAICDNERNITAAANQMGLTQPSISKKLATLEKAIGRPLFYRNGKRLQYETDLCQQVTGVAREILMQCDNLLFIENNTKTEIEGELRIGTTHTQARYVLPKVLKKFHLDYPNVAIRIKQGTPQNLVELLNSGQVDVIICTEALDGHNNLCRIGYFSWNRSLIAPKTHPIAKINNITLQSLAKHPIVTYSAGLTGRNTFDETFKKQGIEPSIMVSAADSDIIKTYVRTGFGVGVIAEMAYEPEVDSDFIVRSLRHLFPEMRVRLAYKRSRYIPKNMQTFIEQFCHENLN